MNESSTTYHHTISMHSNTNQQLKNARIQTSHDESIIKNVREVYDDINKNVKDLEHFYYMNLKLKKMINELIQFYFINDQESNLIYLKSKLFRYDQSLQNHKRNFKKITNEHE